MAGEGCTRVMPVPKPHQVGIEERHTRHAVRNYAV
jgi:hypothetical protein